MKAWLPVFAFSFHVFTVHTHRWFPLTNWSTKWADSNFVWTPRMKTLVEINWLDLDIGLWYHHGLIPGLRMLRIASHLLVHIHYTLWYSKSHQKFCWNYALVYGLSWNLMCSFKISWVIWEHTSTAGYLVTDEINRWWSWFCGYFGRGGLEVFFGMCIISCLVFQVK
jgi:hypothetical protein